MPQTDAALLALRRPLIRPVPTYGLRCYLQRDRTQRLAQWVRFGAEMEIASRNEAAGVRRREDITSLGSKESTKEGVSYRTGLFASCSPGKWIRP